MKYSNFANVLDAIVKHQGQELLKAVLERDGCVDFPLGNCPSVEFYGGNGPCSASVTELYVSNGKLHIGVMDDEGASFTVEPEDLYPGAAQSIFEHLSNEPEPHVVTAVRAGSKDESPDIEYQASKRKFKVVVHWDVAYVETVETENEDEALEVVRRKALEAPSGDWQWLQETDVDVTKQ